MVLAVLVVRVGDVAASPPPRMQVVLAVLVARDGGVLLFHDGVPPFVAPHCYKSTHDTRNILSSTSCS